jgi:hypothetical protein
MYLIQGTNGEITLTQTRVIISRKGYTSWQGGNHGNKEIPIKSITAKIQNAYGVERAIRELRALLPAPPADEYRINAALYYAATIRARRKLDLFHTKHNTGYWKAAQKILAEAIEILGIDWRAAFGTDSIAPADILKI